MHRKYLISVLSLNSSLLLIGALFVLPCHAAFAQSKVMALGVNMVSAQQASVGVYPPEGKGTIKKVLSLNDDLPSGTKLVIPGNTVIKLRSRGGEQNIRSINNKEYEYRVDYEAKGELHTIKGNGSELKNIVSPNNGVGYTYRNSNDRGTTAASKHTEFTFADNSQGDNDRAAIATQEGAIVITDEVPITINGQFVTNNIDGEKSSKTVSYDQVAGEKFTSTNSSIEYKSLDEALAKILGDNQNTRKGITARNADLMCLGHLYMAKGQPAKALEAFSLVLNYYQVQYGDGSVKSINVMMFTAEAYLALNDPEGRQLAVDCVGWLTKDLKEIDRERAYSQNGNLFCAEYAEKCKFIAWGYKALGMAAESEQFARKAAINCN